MSAAIPAQDSGEALVGRECWVWDTCKASNWVEMQQARKRIVLNFTGSRFYPYRTNSEAPLLQEIYDHARPVELGHPDPNHPSHKETKMTELEQARKAYEELGAKLKVLEEAEKVKRPDLAPGQLWLYRDGDIYLSTPSDVLVNTRSWITWAFNAGFKGADKDFTFLGLARDLLTIKVQP